MNLKHLRKRVNVLGSDKREKIYREFSDSVEYTIYTVTYWDDLGKQYKCIFEGDYVSGLQLTHNSIIPKPESNN